MNVKVYFRDFPFGVSKEDLKKVFSEAGEIRSENIVVDAYSGRLLGTY
jgi:RNA recognition motif-containing protein